MLLDKRKKLNYDVFLSWKITNKCNFNCVYCNVNADPDIPHYKKWACNLYNPKYISDCFDDTGKTWLIQLTGGEPFLYKEFVELCNLLTQKHYICVDTNFSRNNLKCFAEIINPSKVYRIDAAFHVEERIKHQQLDGMYTFIENVTYFQKKGFNIRVEYVLYPPLFERASEDIEFLYSSGIREVNVKTFIGYYKNKYYPKSYTAEEKKILKKYIKDNYENEIMNNKYSYFSYKCYAGVNSFIMDIDGKLRRCMTSRRSYGDLFKGKYHFDNEPKPCPYLKCVCPYEGLRGICGGKGTIGSTSKQMMIEIPSFIKSKAKKEKLVRYLRRRLTYK